MADWEGYEELVNQRLLLALIRHNSSSWSCSSATNGRFTWLARLHRRWPAQD